MLAVVGISALVYSLTYHPSDLQEEKVTCKANPPVLKTRTKVKGPKLECSIYGREKIRFFFDVPNGTDPHERPESSEILTTLKEVARVIKEESPDVILLQEMDEDAKRTDNQDQLVELMKLLPEEYSLQCFRILLAK